MTATLTVAQRLCKVLNCCKHKKAIRIEFRWVKPAGDLITHYTVKDGVFQMQKLAADERVVLDFTGKDSEGNDAPLDFTTPPVWSIGDETIATIEPSADGTKVTVHGAKIGTTILQVVADADLGSGVTSINGTLEVEVTAGKAVSITINPGVPEADV